MTKLHNAIFGVAVAGCLFSTISTAAFAGFKPTAEQRSACTGDAMSLCSSAFGNMDRIAACLASKKSQLSAGCRAQFDKH